MSSGMMMGLGKRSPSISDGGTKQFFLSQASKIEILSFIFKSGMMMGLGKRVPSISDGGVCKLVVF